MKLAITSVFTQSYGYAIRSQLAQIQKNLANCPDFTEIAYIYVTDNERPEVAAYGKDLMPDVEFINLTGDYQEAPNYKQDAQRTIARMMAAAWNKATSWGTDYVWNIESDVLPMHNNLRSLLGALRFDDGYFSIAFSPYVSQGGGGLLGGYGTMNNPILPDVYDDERIIPADLKKRVAAHKATQPKGQPPGKDWIDAMKLLDDEIKACPPKGNIFALQAKGYRRRGWGNNAMPQAGKGMIFEIDWCGTGNNLLTREAVLMADFIGYEQAGGTQDLLLSFHKWQPNGLRTACVPHSPCHHVIRKPFLDADDKELSPYTVLVMSHEELDPETKGHIRTKPEPFFDFQANNDRTN